jgi:hypothetical protein
VETIRPDKSGLRACPELAGCVAIGFTEGLSCWPSHQNYKDLFDGQQ